MVRAWIELPEED